MKYSRFSPSSPPPSHTPKYAVRKPSEPQPSSQKPAAKKAPETPDVTAPGVVPRPGVIAIVRRQDKFLLVRRLNAPDAGLWGFPGGRVEPGERLFTAAERELKEETGITGAATHIADILETIRHAPDETLLFHYVIIAVCCIETDSGQTPVAASDDAMEASWFSLQEISALGTQASSGLYNLAIRVFEQDRTNTLVR